MRHYEIKYSSNRALAMHFLKALEEQFLVNGDLSASWRLLLRGLGLGFGHHSCITSNEEPPLSNFNS